MPTGQVMVCTTLKPEWPVVHGSAGCHALLKSADPDAKLLNMSLWDLFGQPGMAASTVACKYCAPSL